MIGQTLGHYRIIEQIGQGGMGVVFRARDERLERDVGLKLLPADALGDEGARRRFRKEALALAKLSHPHIAAVYDFDKQEGLDFLVMEYVAGTTLSHKLAGRSLGEKEVLALGAQIASALEEAHEQGVIHRDLKPGNVVVTAKGQAKVLDFGLAKLLHPQADTAATQTFTETQAAAGTLPYMTPEQLRGESVDARTDIHALGAVLYEMATGQRAFKEDSAPRLTDAILHQPPVPPRGVNARVSPELERIILKCLEKEPENRYQSARELGVDLRRLGAPATATQAAAPQPKLARRGLLLAGAGLVVVLVLVLVALNVGGWRSRLLGGASSVRIESLAVLPLENFSRDPEQEYFADGMTEALITDLAKIGALRVISRTSVMQYKGVKKPLPQIARELNVDAVVEGSVQRSGNRVRITAQLIQAATDRHLWAESYERDLRDVLALQSELARAIANEIRVKVTPQEQTLLANTRAVNPAAHEAYVKGVYYFNDGRDHIGTKRGDKSFQNSVGYLQQAVQIDPNYSLAYAQLARTYHWMASHAGQGGPVAESKAAARRALELDDTLAEAHGALAYVMFRFDRDWAGAEREFKRAIELNPGYGEAHHGYALYLMIMGRLGEAAAEINKAVLLDPLTLPQKVNAAHIYACARQYDKAIEQLQTTLALNANYPAAHLTLGEVYLRKAMYAEAIAEIQKGAEMTGGGAPSQVDLIFAYAASGRRGEASRLLDQLIKRSKREAVPADEIAVAYATLGDNTNAIAWLEKVAQESPEIFGYLRCAEPLDSLRADPRVQEMFHRLGLPP